MSEFIDMRLEPGLWLLGEWSLRWAVLIAALAAWFAVRPPRQAALRLAACQFVLVAGLALPLVPHWWGAALLPAQRMTTTAADDLATEPTIAELPEPALPRPIAKPTKPTAASPSQPTPGTDSNLLDVSAVRPSSSAPARTAEPLGARRIALLIAAALWAVGTCIQLTRLIAAALWLSHLRRSALTPHLRSQELFARCRQEIGLRRRVCLRIHSALTAPVFLGGRRCMILVPNDWEQLPPDAQRAVLWHELTHVVRHDDWAKLVEETICAAFFFHPQVYWLLNRIDGYREQVCDAAAVRRGVAGRMLAQILVDFSRRNTAPRHRDLAMRPALPFFRRRTVKNRIHELLEEKTVARWSAPLVRYQFAGLALIAVSTGVALGGLGLQAADSPPAAAQAASDTAPKAHASPGPTTVPEKPAATTQGAAAPTTLERILAHWKAREERTRSIHFEWDNRLFVGQAAEARRKGKATSQQGVSRSSQFALWAERLFRFRLDRAPIAASAPTATSFAGKTHSVTNGMTELSVQDPGNSAGLPVATFLARRDQIPLATATPALTLTFHPQDAFLLNSPRWKFRVVSEDALVNGLHCVEIQKSDERGDVVEKCWVDPARDDVVVAYELWMGKIKQSIANQVRSAISIEYQPDRVHGWVPARWTLNSFGELSEATVSKYTINEPIPEETFSLKLSPGTDVIDQPNLEHYRVAQDGSKSDVVKFESAMILRAQQVLETRTDFRIEPQSLKDALDFIAARYQIPIFWNQREFAAAGIDLTSEVQCADQGISVAELLKILLAQMSKPIGFRIENEVLQISPRFDGQGPIQPQAVPVPEKLDSPAARNIQKALEQPGDFTIEPQSLKDAFDFIGARYQIRITLDPSINRKFVIHGSFPGVRLRSLLTLLLEGYPQPLGFRIEGKVLKIFPQSAIKKPAAANPADLHKK